MPAPRKAGQGLVAGLGLLVFSAVALPMGDAPPPPPTPVVVPPAVAILGTGRVRRDVIAAGERVEIHTRMPLSLTFDHRVITGGEAVRFLGAVIADLELSE